MTERIIPVPRSRIRMLICLLVPLAAVLSGCRFGHDTARRDGLLRVAVSVPPQAWLVKKIGGDRVEVFCLVDSGVNPHAFHPTDAQITRLMQADVFLPIGMPFEQAPWCRSLLESNAIRVAGAPECTHDSEEASGDHSHDHDHGPHVWLSIAWLKAEAERLAALFGELSPAHAAEFRAAAERTIRELDALDAELREKLAPLRGERFFVYHPAYGAFAEEYGLIETAVEQDGKPPDDRTLSRLQEEAAQATLKVLIVQPQITSPAVEAVAQSARLKTVSCDPLAEDVPTVLRTLADTLSAARSSGGR